MELVGLVTKELGLRFIPNGTALCTFQVDEQRCTAWGALAEQINQYILPRDKVKVFGYIKERWWTEEGVKKRAEDFTVNRLQLLERLKPVEGCCYYCTHFNVDCLKQCFSATGGFNHMESCQVEDRKCTEVDNSSCFEEKNGLGS